MGMFEHFPYTNFHDLNLDWLLKTMKSIKDSLDDLWKQFLESRVPRGGDPNQVLTKTTADDFAMAWKDVPHELPEGGTEGQMLSKKSDANYDVQWSDVPESLPEGGTQGQVLAKKSAENFDVEWVDQSGDTSKFLPLAGGTMNDKASIAGKSLNIGSGISGGEMYLGRAKGNNDSWLRIRSSNVTMPGNVQIDSQGINLGRKQTDDENYAARKGYVDSVAVPAGGTIGQVLAKKSNTDRDCEWVDQSGGGTGNYLPLAGGTMDQDATINFTESGSGHSELSSGELHHTGNPFQFVGDFNFQTDCPTTQGTPQTANDLTPKGYVDGVAIPAGGTTGQVLGKKSDSDRDCEWINAPTPELPNSTKAFVYRLPYISGTARTELTNFINSLSEHFKTTYGVINLSINIPVLGGSITDETAVGIAASFNIALGASPQIPLYGYKNGVVSKIATLELSPGNSAYITMENGFSTGSALNAYLSVSDFKKPVFYQNT